MQNHTKWKFFLYKYIKNMPTFLCVENSQSIKKLNKKSDTISIQKPLFRDQVPKILEH